MEKGYCHGAYVLLHFNNKVHVNRNEDQLDTDSDMYEDEMEGVIINNEREPQGRMVKRENYGGVYDKKAVVHDKRWDVYMSEKILLYIKGVYFVGVSCSYWKKLI